MPSHPLFGFDPVRPLCLPPDAADEVLWHYLSHRVMRRAASLGDHAGRVSLCRRGAMRERGAGVLADLLHVLDGRGDAFARRMFGLLTAGLRSDERLMFEAWLDGEVPPEARTRALRGRVLPTLADALARAAIVDAAPTGR